MSEYVTATVGRGGRVRIPRSVLHALNITELETAQIAFRIDGKNVRVARLEEVVRWP